MSIGDVKRALSGESTNNPNANLYRYGKTSASDLQIQEIDGIFNKIHQNINLDARELQLLPDEYAKDLILRYRQNKGSYLGDDRAKILTPAFEGIARRHALRKVQKTDEVKEIAGIKNDLGKYLQDVYQFTDPISSDPAFDQVEAGKYKKFNAENLLENVPLLKTRFPEERVDQVVKKFTDIESDKYGLLNGDDAFGYLLTDGGTNFEMDVVDAILSRHPEDSHLNNFAWLSGIHGFNYLSDITTTIERLDQESEEYLLSAQGVKDVNKIVRFIDFYQSEKSFGYQLTESIIDLAQMFITRASTKKFDKALAERVSGYMQNSVTKALGKKFRDKLARVNPLLKKTIKTAGEEAKLALHPLGYGTDTLERTMQYKAFDREFVALEVEDGQFLGMNFLEPRETMTAFYSAFGNQYVENISERLGGAFNRIGGALSENEVTGQFLNTALFKAFKNVNPQITDNAITEFIKLSKFQGIIPEMLEERATSVMQGALGLDQPGQDYDPLFFMTNEEGEQEFKFKDIVIPSAEEFGVEFFTILAGVGLSRGAEALSPDGIGPIVYKKPDVVVKGSDPSVREFVSAWKDRNLNVIDTVMAVANERLERSGKKPLKYRNSSKVDSRYLQKAKEQGADVLVPELKEFISNPDNAELIDYAINWYGSNYNQAIVNLQQNYFPELENPDQRSLFDAIVAFTSLRSAPEKNMRNAINEYMRVGGADFDQKVTNQITKNIGIFQKIAEHKGGYAGAMDFLGQQMTGQDLRDELFKMGLYTNTIKGKTGKDGKTKISGQLPNSIKLNDMTYAAEIFGPKIGTFMLNLSGIDNVATIDLWMVRQISTALGDPFTETTLKQANFKLRRAIEKGAKEKIGETKRGKDIYEYSPGWTGSDWSDGLESQIVDKADRTRDRIVLYREVVNEIQSQLNNDLGTDFSVNQVQAMLWYMEKAIFTRAGTAGSEVELADYLSVSESFVNSGEVFNENTQRRIRSDKQLGAEQRAEQEDLRKSEDDSKDGVQKKGASARQTDSEDELSRQSDRNVGTSSQKGVSKKQPSLLKKSVPQVSRLAPEESELFYNALVKHQSEDVFGAAVDPHSPEYWAGPTVDNEDPSITYEPIVFMDNTRTAGVALVKVTKDGESKIDIQGVFRGDQSPLIGDELMRKALRQAIDIVGPDGKITLDAFAPYLPKWYESYGFVETGRVDWDDKYAPQEWPFQKYMQDFPDIPDGKPQIVFMEWNPSKAGPLFKNKLGLLQETVVDEQTPLGYITQKINDNLTRIKDVDTATEKQRGAPLQDNERVYSQSRRAPNIAINKIEKVMDLLENKEGTGLFDRMWKDGITPDDLSVYLHALHTREYIAHVKKTAGGDKKRKDAGLNKRGELMTPERADEIIEQFKGTKMEDYAKEFDKTIIKRNVNVREQGGLLDKDTAQRFRGIDPNAGDAKKQKKNKKKTIFKNYVPFEVEFEDDGQVGGIHQYSDGTRGISLSGPESRAIKGSQDILQRKDPVLTAIQNLSLGIMRAEQNQVNLKLLNQMRASDIKVKNQDGELVDLFDIQEAVVDSDANIYNAEGMPIGVRTTSLADNQILIKENGVEYVVTINDKPLAESFRAKESFSRDNVFVNVLNTVNNFRKVYMTAYSPTWWVGNFQADLQNALVNAGVENGASIAVDVAANSLSSMKSIYKAQTDPNYTDDFVEAYEEMKAYGGKVSFFNPKDLQDRFGDIDKKLVKMAAGKSKSSMPRQIVDYVNVLNQSAENAMRLATYKAFRDAGISAEQAALAARDITIDFNKSGQLSRGIEAAYMFSKVGINSIYRFGQAIKNNPKGSAAASTGLFGLGMGLAAMAKAYDEEEWEKLSDFEKYHYWHIPNIFAMLDTAEDGKATINPQPDNPMGFIPIKMPYGWGMVSGMGVLLQEYNDRKSKLQDDETLEDFWGPKMLTLVSNHFSPASSFLPTGFDMVYEMSQNRDGIGRNIKPHKFDLDASDFETYYPNVAPYAKDFAFLLSNFPIGSLQPTGEVDPTTGRVKYKNHSGLDISPDELDYLFGQFFGGLYNSMEGTVKLLSPNNYTEGWNKITNDYEGLDPKKNPFLKKIWTYKPTVNVQDLRLKRGLYDSKRRNLNQFELEHIEAALDHLFSNGKLSLQDHNKYWREIFRNQADLSTVVPSIREDIEKYYLGTERATGKKVQVKLDEAVNKLKEEKDIRKSIER
jgi:hypothetical protein